MTNAYRISNDFKLFLCDELLSLVAVMQTDDVGGRLTFLNWEFGSELTKKKTRRHKSEAARKKDVVIGASATSFFN